MAGNHAQPNHPATGPRQMQWIDFAAGVFFHPEWPIERRTGHWMQHPGGVMAFHPWDVSHDAWNERMKACDAADEVEAQRPSVDALAVAELLRPMRESHAVE